MSMMDPKTRETREPDSYQERLERLAQHEPAIAALFQPADAPLAQQQSQPPVLTLEQAQANAKATLTAWEEADSYYEQCYTAHQDALRAYREMSTATHTVEAEATRMRQLRATASHSPVAYRQMTLALEAMAEVYTALHLPNAQAKLDDAQHALEAANSDLEECMRLDALAQVALKTARANGGQGAQQS